MIRLNKHRLVICIILSLLVFLGTNPFYRDRYTAELHAIICASINAFSSALFGTLIYCKWTNRITSRLRILFLVLITLQVPFHSIFIVMNWASFLFLPLSLIVIALLIISHFKYKKHPSQKGEL